MTWVNPTSTPNHDSYGFYAEHTNGLFVSGQVLNLNYGDRDELAPALADEVIADFVALMSASPDFVSVQAFRSESVVNRTYTP